MSKYAFELVQSIDGVGGQRREEASKRLQRLECKGNSEKLESCDPTKKLPRHVQVWHQTLEQASINDDAAYQKALAAVLHKNVCTDSDNSTYILRGLASDALTALVASNDSADYDRDIVSKIREKLKFEPVRADPFRYARLESKAIALGDLAQSSDCPALTALPEEDKAGLLIIHGTYLQQRGEFDAAITDFERAISVAPENPVAYLYRGLNYINKHDLDRAIADFTDVTKLAPNDSTAYKLRGYAYVYKQDFDHAISDLTKVIELATALDAYGTRGLAYAAKGSYDAALADYDEAIKLDSKSAKVLDDRGEAYANKGDYGRAITDYNAAIKLDPKYARAFTDRGDVFAAKQDYGRAIADYKEAINLVSNDEDRARVRRHRGALFLGRNEIERAIADFEEAIRLDPKTAYGAYGVLWLYLAQARSGNSKAAAELEANARKLNPRDWLSDWSYPAVEMFLGKRTPEEIVRAAPATSVERCDAKVYASEWHLLQGDRAKAVDALNGAVSSCPEAYVAYSFARAELKRLQPP
jgi:tetratricopeptide (TPR) repeat protein